MYAEESLAARKKTAGDAPFLSALRSSNPDKRMAAANILAHRGSAQGIEVLIEALKDPQPGIRIQAANSLKDIKDAGALDALLAAMHDPDMNVRRQVVAAVAQTGDSRAMAPLLAGLESASKTEKGIYVGALGQMGEQGVDPLLAFLKSGNWEWKSGVVSALGNTKSKRAVPALIEQLRDPYDGMAHLNGANALAEIGDPSAIGPLIELMKGPSFDGTRESLPGVLVKIGSPAVEPLIAVLQDENKHARFLASEALSNIKDPRAEKALIDALHEGNAPAIAGASMFFIFRGEPGSEEALVEALNQYGDEQMALLLLNCGNPKLEAGAREWGHKRRYAMQQQVYGLMWGHAPTTPSPCELDMDS
jgi:HEAT repeat protein